MKASERCSCGSGVPLNDCCGRWLNGHEDAPTAEALMRSRYTAYVSERHDYLLKTWHPTTRPEKDALGRISLYWIGLKIVRTDQGGRYATSGVVEFIASYVHESGVIEGHEPYFPIFFQPSILKIGAVNSFLSFATLSSYVFHMACDKNSESLKLSGYNLSPDFVGKPTYIALNHTPDS